LGMEKKGIKGGEVLEKSQNVDRLLTGGGKRKKTTGEEEKREEMRKEWGKGAQRHG